MAGGSGKATYYAVLGVARDASAGEIRAAWRRLSLIWHPDKLKGAAGDHSRQKEQALARYHEIQEAYKVLSDPSRKAMYDRALLQQQRFDDAANGRDKKSLVGVLERPGGCGTVDDPSDRVDKIEIKIKSSSSSARTGRPASGRIDLSFTFTTAAAPDEGTSPGGGGPRNARCAAGSSSAPRRRAAPRSKLQTLIEARLRCGRKD